LQAELSLPFTDIAGYILPNSVNPPRNPDELPPFALWPAFPASDYYGGSDTTQVSPPDL